jgi:hypothetical protein
MEQDRYKQNHFLYIAGMFSLIISLGLFAFSLFLIPHLIFGWHYNVPDFLIDLIAMFENDYEMSTAKVKWLLFLVLDVPAVVLFIVADVLSNKIDNKIYKANRSATQSPTRKMDGQSGLRESGVLFLRMTMIVIVVFAVAGFFQWTIS